MKNSLLRAHLKGRMRWFTRGVAVNAILSTLFTYKGAEIALAADDWDEKVLAAALALASGIMIYLIWRLLFLTAISETGVGPRLASLGKTAFGAVMIIAASSWLMVANFAAPNVDAVQMRNTIAAFERHSDETYRRSIQAVAFGPQINALASDLSKRAKLERDEGISTGIPGEGPVESELDAAAAMLVELAGMIEKTGAQIEEKRAAAAMSLDEMRAAANTDGPADTRWSDFDRHASDWRASMARMNTDQSTRATMAELSAVARDLGSAVKLSGSRRVAESQRQAFAKYRALIAGKVQPVIVEARRQLSADAKAVPDVERDDIVWAVLINWQHFAAFWLLGLGIDFGAPLIMLISIHVATVTMTPRDHFAARIEDATVGELLIAKMAQKALRQIELDGRSNDIIKDKLIGHDPDLDDDDGDQPAGVKEGKDDA